MNYGLQLLLTCLPAFGLVGDATLAEHIEAKLSAGGHIHLPAGVYVIHRTVVLAPGTELTCKPGAEITDDAKQHLAAMFVSHGTGITVRGCDLSSRGSSIIFAPGSGTSHLVLNSIRFRSENDAHAIWIDQPGVSEVSVTNSSFDRVAYAVGVNVHAGDLHGLLIDGDSFTNIHSDGVELNNPVTNDCCGLKLPEGMTASAIVIKNNNFSIVHYAGSNLSSGFCVGVAGAHNVTIEDNRCIAWNEGIHIEDRAFGIRIARNVITTDDKAGHAYQSAIQIIDGHDITVEDNEIADAEADGIYISYDKAHQLNTFSLSGNRISNCGDVGIFVAGGSLGPMNGTISHNEVFGCRRQIFLSGKLAQLIIRDNRLDSSRGCPIARSANLTIDDRQFFSNLDRTSGHTITLSCALIEPEPVGIRR